MDTLFPMDPLYPEGFQYRENFITVEEETRLLKVIAAIPLHTFQFQGYEAKRKVASFGYEWSFTERKLEKGKAIPQPFTWLIERVAAFALYAPVKLTTVRRFKLTMFRRTKLTTAGRGKLTT